jgi:hypothetical protein
VSGKLDDELNLSGNPHGADRSIGAPHAPPQAESSNVIVHPVGIRLDAPRKSPLVHGVGNLPSGGTDGKKKMGKSNKKL